MSDEPGPSKKAPDGPRADMSLKEYLALPENKDANLVMPLSWCPHLESSVKVCPPELSVKAKCEECDNVGENWVCLFCYTVHCSRYVNEHMLMHSISNEGHIMTLSFSDLSVWCYGCDDYVDNVVTDEAKDKLHMDKFGEPMPRKREGAVLELG